ncbi:hypothetical protein MSG28_010999 [Choristoneura fumiferana]|uniref:Uncharacterized protein n=1 Tax=Choristoneura fumiferana TaxID=7141 RepID=A0ACC0KQH7_CHOFU|nr:hypothetical protein MSG28_010999 [Choristoneura fumiferana]
MQRVTLFLLSAVLAVVLAEGEYYVPRAYYTIDSAGHASAPVPLRRLRRSFNPNWPGYNGGGASANANANANASVIGTGGGAGAGRLTVPNRAGQFRRLAGTIQGGHSVSASSSVGVDGLGNGYYDQYTSVDN